MGFSPPRIHPQQHFSEVGRVNTASTSTDCHYCRKGVIFAIEQSLDLHDAEQHLKVSELLHDLIRGVTIPGLIGHVDQHIDIAQALGDIHNPSKLGLAVAERTGDFLSCLRVVPQIGNRCLFGQRGNLDLQALRVKHRLNGGEGGAKGGDAGLKVEFAHSPLRLVEALKTSAR